LIEGINIYVIVFDKSCYSDGSAKIKKVKHS
jgi:hypothetical protein